jgi:membrane protein YqaA with SNARE-associated domain
MRRKLIRLLEICALTIYVAVLVFVVAFFTVLRDEIISFVAQYGYTSIFVTSFLTDMFLQPIGPDVPLIAGIIAKLNVVLAFFAAWVGSVLASLVGYRLGHVWGIYGFRELYGEKAYKKWGRLYHRRGRLVLLVAALTPVPYVPFCWLSGAFNLSKMNFFLYGILPRGLRLVGVTYTTFLIVGM